MTARSVNADPAGRVHSTLWTKLDRFDVDRDGKLSLRETCGLFRAVGFSPAWAAVSGVLTAVWRGSLSSGKLTFTIELAHVGKTLVKGQTGVWDEHGNSSPAARERFLADVAADGDGKITLAVLRARVVSDARASIRKHPPKFAVLEGLTRKRRFAESYSAWVQLMELASQKDEHGVRYLTPDQVQSVFDGTLFDMILSRAPRADRISPARIVKELIGATIHA